MGEQRTKKKCQCAKCGKTMDESQFYIYKNGQRCQICKLCLTMHIDNFNPSTFLWLLQKFNVPYVSGEWNTLRDRAYARDPFAMNGMSVFGKYLAKMKLQQWSKYSWADSEQLQQGIKKYKTDTRTQEELAEYRKELKDKLDAGEISQAQYRTLVPTQVQKQEQPEIISMSQAYQSALSSPYDRVSGPKGDNPFIQSNFISQDELPDPSAELTQDDKVYLAMKWGRTYTPQQWVQLEQKYTEMLQCFDIQDSDTVGSLVLICKTYLKMNEAIDMGDLNGFNNLSRTYDALRKSAKFTAVQRKEQKDDFVDSVGQLVAYCEKKKGAIPRHDISVDHDIFDQVIRDLKSYNQSLVKNDPAIAREIQDYLKKREFSEQAKRDKENARKNDEPMYVINDQDIIDFNKHQAEQASQDAMFSILQEDKNK